MSKSNYSSYKKYHRRVLLDMHIPDWDKSFLEKFDPVKLAHNYAKANIDSAMIYTQSHTGFCFWPVKDGYAHPIIKGRDWVKEIADELRKKDISVYGYYSGIFNNKAFLDHPEWRIEPRPDMSGGAFHGERYGHICPNNKEYLSFMKSQLDDLMKDHSFDAFFIDMTFWPGICRCNSCSEKFREEYDHEIPEKIDWFDPVWCAFQTARERWITEYADFVNGVLKANAPGLPVFHNFAIGLFNWRWGINFDITYKNDFLGGDFYGSPAEQFLTSRLMLNLSEGQPFEFMTSRCIHLTDHVENKSTELVEIQALASLAGNASFRILDAVDPAGTMNESFYSWMKPIYDRLAKYEHLEGALPVEDVVVYVSDYSKVNFNENGISLDDNTKRFNPSPHLEAIKGAVKTLQQTHLPVGVITKKQLPFLNRYSLVVLPNILRMSANEIKAFKAYVKQGGRLYASGQTSLNTINGKRHENFLMADLFGCRFKEELDGNMVYFKPINAQWKDLLLGQDYLSLEKNKNGNGGVVYVENDVNTKIIATLSFPYGYPNKGSIFNQYWSSIHSSPPFKDTQIPGIVENKSGKGKVVYSVSDIESSSLESHKRLFVKLISDLMPEKPQFESDAHLDIWLTAYHYPEEKCYMINFLNFPENVPLIPHRNISFKFRKKEDAIFTQLQVIPDGINLDFVLDKSGSLNCVIPELVDFVRLRLDYKTR